MASARLGILKKENMNKNSEFVDRTNRALERMDKSDMKGLSKEEFLKDLKSW